MYWLHHLLNYLHYALFASQNNASLIVIYYFYPSFSTILLIVFSFEGGHMTQTIDESRAQLIANLQERAEELAQLNRIAIALTSEFDLQRLLQMITDAARKVTAAQYAAFFLIPEIVAVDADIPTNKIGFNLAAISGATERIAAHFSH